MFLLPSLIKEGLGVVILENHHLAPTEVGALLLHKEERKAETKNTRRQRVSSSARTETILPQSEMFYVLPLQERPHVFSCVPRGNYTSHSGKQDTGSDKPSHRSRDGSDEHRGEYQRGSCAPPHRISFFQLRRLSLAHLTSFKAK